ncbi:GntR family transcriptional regulator [Bifidobacterium bohemicum]|uniref:GntR family transcriptional regulator n=1 Tax=Bifidobacterium bohemicum DSM 22767 TaxID=1437606 RepID=A0A086ZJF4_9BIFI|nr:GntR family transcriptional regulator [Bifidobacterium bohemicum]KFI46654.1 GntR family transcriptional regulator [Bifidobacterium bohemicum DSM 22767]SCB77868.1 GntR family transcriptional regulator [Bifidobacterium bohemicum]
MKLIISSVSGEPIYEQIKRQIRHAVFDGELKPGDALPSLRSLARELRISVLTVTRAYNELANEGIVVNVQGKGSYVADHADATMRETLAGQVDNALRQVGVAARAAGIPIVDLMGMLEKAYNEAG